MAEGLTPLLPFRMGTSGFGYLCLQKALVIWDRAQPRGP